MLICNMLFIEICCDSTAHLYVGKRILHCLFVAASQLPEARGRFLVLPSRKCT